MLFANILVLAYIFITGGGVELWKNKITDCVKGRYMEDSVTFHIYTRYVVKVLLSFLIFY